MTHFPVRRRTGPACWGVLAAHLLAVLWMFGVPVAHAGTVDDDATLVGSKTTPVSREFTIVQAGTYELALSDVGFPVPLVSVQAAITRGDKLVVVRDMPGTVSFAAAAGTYELQVAGIAADATGLGSFAVKVTSVPAGSTPLDYSDVVETPQAAPPAGQLTLQTQVTLVEAGAHRIPLTDIAFPEPLASIELLLTRGGVEYARLDAANPAADFTGCGRRVRPPGRRAGGSDHCDRVVRRQGHQPRFQRAGLRRELPDRQHYRDRLRDASSRRYLQHGGHRFLGFPVALGAASATLVRGSELLARVAGGASVSFNATAGVVDLYALPTS